MDRTAPQEQALDNVIDWLQNGAPHVTLKDGHLISGFDFSTYASPDHKLKDNTGQCGTVACIAGAVSLFKTQSFSEYKRSDAITPEYFASMALGLKNSDEAAMLFYPFELGFLSIQKYYADHRRQVRALPLNPGFDEEAFESIELEGLYLEQTRLASPQQVARVLLHFKKTGFIDWFILETPMPVKSNKQLKTEETQ